MDGGSRTVVIYIPMLFQDNLLIFTFVSVKQIINIWGIPCQVNQPFHHHQPICLKIAVPLVTNMPLLL